MSRLVRLFLLLVAVNAVIGSVVLIAGGMDGAGGRVFLTSVLVTLAMVGGTACAAGWREPRRRPIAVAGVLATALAFGLAVAMIWWSIDSEFVGKLFGSALIVAVAAAGICLLGLASLAPRHRWTFALAEALTAVVVAMALVAMWGELSGDWYFRMLGVLCVALASLAIVIPVLQRVYRGEVRSPGAFCPRCGAPSPSLAGIETTCTACGARYLIRFVDEPSPNGAVANPAAPRVLGPEN